MLYYNAKPRTLQTCVFRDGHWESMKPRCSGFSVTFLPQAICACSFQQNGSLCSCAADLSPQILTKSDAVSQESWLQADTEEQGRLVQRSPNRRGTKGIRQLVDKLHEDASTALSLEAETTTCSSTHHHSLNATCAMR